MFKSKKIIVFNDKYPLIGPLLWVLSIQYFILQYIVSLDWPVPYSIFKNTISDLGNTSCSFYSGRYVCSPLHTWMNGAFLLLGLTMISGSLLIYHEFKENKLSALGFIFMALSGVGTLLVGLFPENTVGLLHSLGAAIVFSLGNIGIIIFGISLKMAKPLRTYSLISGIVALIALAFFTFHHYLGLQEGGMERIVAYPQTIWLIVFGIYTSKNRFNASKAK